MIGQGFILRKYRINKCYFKINPTVSQEKSNEIGCNVRMNQSVSTTIQKKQDRGIHRHSISLCLKQIKIF